MGLKIVIGDKISIYKVINVRNFIILIDSNRLQKFPNLTMLPPKT